MSQFDFRGKTIHYETYGEGAPLVVLNGIMMSCGSWAEFIEPFSANNMLIMLDFLDQVGSSKMVGEEYKQDIQVEVVKSLLDHLKIHKVSLMGISYGGEIAIQFAVKYQDYLDKLLLFNTTSYTGGWLKDIGEGWILAEKDPSAYYYTTIPIIYSPGFYMKNAEWMENRRKLLTTTAFANPEFLGAMERLTRSSEGYDYRDRLKEIKVPTLVVSSQQDYLLPMNEQQYIAEQIPNSHYCIIPGSGHASMYEQPVLFATLVLGFVNNPKMKFNIV